MAGNERGKRRGKDSGLPPDPCGESGDSAGALWGQIALFDLQTEHAAGPVVAAVPVYIVVGGKLESVVHQKCTAEGFAFKG